MTTALLFGTMIRPDIVGAFGLGVVSGVGIICSPVLLPPFTVYKAYKNYQKNPGILRNENYVDLTNFN